MIARVAALVAQMVLFGLWGLALWSTWESGGELWPLALMGCFLVAGAIAGHVAARRNLKARREVARRPTRTTVKGSAVVNGSIIGRHVPRA